MKSGSQLIAVFGGGKDAVSTLASVREIVCGTLGSGSTQVEIAKGSIVIYITFMEDDVNISGVVVGLLRKGAQLSYINDPDGQAGFMTPVFEGSPLHRLSVLPVAPAFLVLGAILYALVTLIYPLIIALTTVQRLRQARTGAGLSLQSQLACDTQVL